MVFCLSSVLAVARGSATRRCSVICSIMCLCGEMNLQLTEDAVDIGLGSILYLFDWNIDIGIFYIESVINPFTLCPVSHTNTQ